jgi:hypothetical protein
MQYTFSLSILVLQETIDAVCSVSPTEHEMFLSEERYQIAAGRKATTIFTKPNDHPELQQIVDFDSGTQTAQSYPLLRLNISGIARFMSSGRSRSEGSKMPLMVLISRAIDNHLFHSKK